MSLIHPVKKVYITQDWGVNLDRYKRFNLLGHNGVDYRAFLPDGQRCFVGEKSEVIAPHSGTVIENRFDAQGYGWYVKIENNKEGSILAHFSSQSLLKVNQHVNQGAFVGYQGTTGNSSGIHLHWGYYPKPRNKSNGYSGTINQLPLIGKGESMSDPDIAKQLEMCKEEQKKNDERIFDAREGRKKAEARVIEIEADLQKLKKQLADTERGCQSQLEVINGAKSAFLERVIFHTQKPITDFDEAEQAIGQMRADIERLETLKVENQPNKVLVQQLLKRFLGRLK